MTRDGPVLSVRAAQTETQKKGSGLDGPGPAARFANHEVHDQIERHVEEQRLCAVAAAVLRDVADDLAVVREGDIRCAIELHGVLMKRRGRSVRARACESRFGRTSGPFPPVVAHGLLF